jgi:hypothetical protein
MSYETTTFDATLSCAAGNDAALAAELRAVFLSSARRQADLLRRSRCDANWHMAALRLRGIAASFNAEELLSLADAALASAPGEPSVIRKIEEQFTLLDRTSAVY